MVYSKWNNALGWLCFSIAGMVYLLTLEPTVSFWDCGEFIAAAYKLQIVHQPGAPLFLMIQNVFANLAFARPELIAYFMNMGSAVCSALTIMFLFWTITALARKVCWGRREELTAAALIRIMGAGLVGALAFAFSDTFWFSAVETEVYAMASLCTAIVFWAILKWEARADEPGADRWLVLVAFIMGLSIGVHLLNLLAVPALALVIYFRRSPVITAWGVARALLWGCLVLAVVLWGIIQYLVKAAAYTDLFFVNTMGFGFGTGIAVLIIVIAGGLAAGIVYSVHKMKPRLNLVLLCTAFVIFGYSSFTMVVIRAQAPISLNNTDPDDAFSFLHYLSRGQYISNPLLKGPYFNSQPVGIKEGSSVYTRGKDRYEQTGRQWEYVYDREALFPRLSSERDFHPQLYRYWLGLGEEEQVSFVHNLKFFNTYQAGHMYARYFMWNFAGRQNDKQGRLNDLTNGNWISGIPIIDQARLGGQDALPASQTNDPSNNRFYMLPLVLGLIGILWHIKRQRRDAGVVGLLFFFTGLAIVLYLNDTPLQPRERDYVYAGSFYTFAIWIGLGVLGIAEFLQCRLKVSHAGAIAVAVGLLMAPTLMAVEGWDDHNRSGKYTARDVYARNYLESCAPDAILFTYGDNETYPLWYAQEVEGIRPDIRVINLGLLSAEWYVRQQQNKINAAEPLPMSLKEEQYKPGTRESIRYHDYGIKDSMELENVLDVLLSDHPADKHPDGSGENFLPTRNLKLTIHKADVVRNNVVPEKWIPAITDTMRWTYNKDMVTRAQLCIFDLLIQNKWKRPIYFASTMPKSEFMGLDNYLVREGLAYRLMPVGIAPNLPAKEEAGITADRINPDTMYTNMVEKFAWGNMPSATYLDPISYQLVPEITTGFTDLANTLIAEKQPEKARKALHRCLEVLPGNIRDLEQSTALYYLADTLNELGDQENAVKLMEKNAAFITDELNYYLAIAQTKPNLEERNIYTGMHLLDSMRESARKHKQTALFDRLNEQFASLNNKIASFN